MREIKFRFWDKDYNKFDEYHINRISVSELESDWVKKRFVRCQFTGLKDKNGKEIYEGDILKTESFLTKIIDNSIVPNSDHVNYYLIEFNLDKNVNGWQLKTIKTTRSNNFGLGNISSSFLYTYTDKAEVIGNIYENPELLS